jgi:hypothetical protein
MSAAWFCPQHGRPASACVAAAPNPVHVRCSPAWIVRR